MRAGGARAAVIGRRAGRGRGCGGRPEPPAGRAIVLPRPGRGVALGQWWGGGVEGRFSGSAVPTWALCCVSVAGYRLTDLWAV